MKANKPLSHPKEVTLGIILDSCNHEKTANIIPKAEMKSQTSFFILFFFTTY